MSELMNERVGEQVNKWVNKLVSGWVNKRLGERGRWKMKREAVYGREREMENEEGGCVWVQAHKHYLGHWYTWWSLSSPDGNYALAGSSDGTLFIWNIAKTRVERTLREHRYPHFFFFCMLFLSFSLKSVRSSVCQSPCGNPDERALWWETPLLSDPHFCCFFRPFPSYLITVIMKY